MLLTSGPVDHLDHSAYQQFWGGRAGWTPPASCPPRGTTAAGAWPPGCSLRPALWAPWASGGGGTGYGRGRGAVPGGGGSAVGGVAGDLPRHRGGAELAVPAAGAGRAVLPDRLLLRQALHRLPAGVPRSGAGDRADRGVDRGHRALVVAGVRTRAGGRCLDRR